MAVQAPNVDDIGEIVALVLSMLIFVAIMSVILSQRSQTVDVIKAAAAGFTDILKTAMSPINGG